MSEKLVKKKEIGIFLMPVYVDALDKLVEVGVFESHSEAVRAALRPLFSGFEMHPFSTKKE